LTEDAGHRPKVDSQRIPIPVENISDDTDDDTNADANADNDNNEEKKVKKASSDDSSKLSNVNLNRSCSYASQASHRLLHTGQNSADLG